MAETFGADLAVARERIGSWSQLVRVDSFVESDGKGHGTRRMRLVNGGGLEFEVHPDRALDIGRATVDGVPVAWISPVTMTGPDAAEPEGKGWLRTFGGGLLATCGLDTFGPPDVDGADVLGQHGRIGTQRASVTHAEASAAGVSVAGEVRQATVFGEDLVLRRRLSSEIGSDTLVIEDSVTNEAFHDQPHMILYHLNFGWPLVDQDTTIRIPATSVVPRDADAAAGAAGRESFPRPTPGFREQVFTHTLPGEQEVDIVVENRARGLRATVTVDAGRLPWVHQWTMAGQGHYALGIEPANSPSLAGRSAARAAGDVRVLGPGESVEYRLVIRLEHDRAATGTGGRG